MAITLPGPGRRGWWAEDEDHDPDSCSPAIAILNDYIALPRYDREDIMSDDEKNDNERNNKKNDDRLNVTEIEDIYLGLQWLLYQCQMYSSAVPHSWSLYRPLYITNIARSSIIIPFINSLPGKFPTFLPQQTTYLNTVNTPNEKKVLVHDLK